MGAQAQAAGLIIPRPSRLSHPSVAVAGSALLPGLGQIFVGRWGRGLALMAPTVVIGVGLGGLAARGRGDVIGLLLTPDFLWAVFVIDMAVLAWRLFAMFDAYQLARNQHPGSVGALAAGTLSLAALFVAVPHLLLGSSSLAAADLVTSVFQPTPVAAPAPTTTQPARVLGQSLTTVPSVTTVPPTTTLPPTSTAPPTTIPGSFVAGLPPPPTFAETEEVEKALAEVNPMTGVDRITILLAGRDAGPGRGGGRTDAMMVASLDIRTGQALMFGFPRNMSWVPLPTWLQDTFDPECKCFPEQLNHLYVRTKDWSDTFPNEVDPGMAALREVLEHLMGIPIDYYVRVDMRGFAELIDALGGVTIYARASIQDRVSPIREEEEWIEVEVGPGRNHLHGREALAYVRSRYGSSDYNRMARQRCVLSALAARADPLRLAARLPRIAKAIKWHTVTDIDVGLVPILATHAARIDAENIATVGFVPDYYVSEVIDGRWAPDVEKIQRTVQDMLNGDYRSILVTSGGESECGV